MGLVYFLVYLFLEILFSYEFAKIFTPLGFFIEVLVTAIIGVYILRDIHFSLSENMIRVLKREITQEEFISIEIFKFIGAILLVIPGFFSDILGALFLFEPFSKWIARKFLPKDDIKYKNAFNDFKDDDIIDVEIIEEIERR